MFEAVDVDQFLYERLSGDATLAGLLGEGRRLWSGLAEQESSAPYVVWSPSTVTDRHVVGADRVMTVGVWMVKTVDRATSFPVDAANRVDELLDGASGEAGGTVVNKVVRESTVQYVEADQGVEWRHLGGMYRIWTYQIP
jgi:hypothetical protein